jgi:polyisoprenoid-binding protein YceI
MALAPDFSTTQRLVSQMLSTGFLSVAALHSGAALAQAAAPQKLVAAQSEISFISKQMGVPVEGRFKQFDAQMSFDPKKLETSKVAFTIALGSVQIGDAETLKELAKAAWFNSAQFPQASFTSTAIKPLGGGKFEISGKLNIKGNVRDIVVPIALTQAGAASTATGSFVIKRIDFKIGDGEWNDTSIVANDVTVKLKLVLTGIAAL